MGIYVFSFPTKNRNKYLLDNKGICYVHPKLAKDSEDEYYRKKYSYLEKHGFFTNDNCRHNERINADLVKNKVKSLLNYLFDLWKNNLQESYDGITYISL
jgi:hypothetical protein